MSEESQVILNHLQLKLANGKLVPVAAERVIKLALDALVDPAPDEQQVTAARIEAIYNSLSEQAVTQIDADTAISRIKWVTTTHHSLEEQEITPVDKNVNALQGKLSDAIARVKEIFIETQAAEFDGLTDILVSYPGIDSEEVTLAKMNADRRRSLLIRYKFLNAIKFSELIPSSSPPSNVARSVKLWAKENRVIAVRAGREYRYPALQIDPKTSAVYPEIVDLLKRGVQAGLTHWEIFDWMASPMDIGHYELPDIKNIHIDKDDFSTPKELFDLARKAAQDKSSGEAQTIVPLESLREGDTASFKRAVELFLKDQDGNEV